MCRTLPWVLMSVAILSMRADANQLSSVALLQSIASAMNHMLQYPAYLNIDTMFAVAIAESRLSNAARNLATVQPPRLYEHKLLSQLMPYFDLVRKRGTVYLNPETREMKLIADSLLDPNLWAGNIPFKNMSLGDTTKRYSLAELVNNQYSGSPNEDSSDACIGELLNGYVSSVFGRSLRCSISDTCVRIMTNGPAFGYPLTHRLLYKMIAERVGCASDYGYRVRDSSSRLCSEIYTQTLSLYEAGVPDFSKDLFTEQILLCGLEGHQEFLKPEFALKLLQWQGRLGCWGLNTFHEILSNRRDKRNAGPMPGGCVNHLTGLATATLALYTDALISNMTTTSY